MNSKQIVCLSVSFFLALSSVGWAMAIIILGSEPEWLALSILCAAWSIISFYISQLVA